MAESSKKKAKAKKKVESMKQDALSKHSKTMNTTLQWQGKSRY